MIASKQEILLSNDDALFKARLGEVLKSVREELDDHREAINENTTEIEGNHEYLQGIDEKIEKINARLDELFLLVVGEKKEESFSISPLTKREKDVFQALYSLGEGVMGITYRAIARKLGISEALVAQYVTNMIEKGIPVQKKFSGGKAYVQLDSGFRKKQAKDNIIGLNSRLTCWV